MKIFNTFIVLFFAVCMVYGLPSKTEEVVDSKEISNLLDENIDFDLTMSLYFFSGMEGDQISRWFHKELNEVEESYIEENKDALKGADDSVVIKKLREESYPKLIESGKKVYAAKNTSTTPDLTKREDCSVWEASACAILCGPEVTLCILIKPSDPHKCLNVVADDCHQCVKCY